MDWSVFINFVVLVLGTMGGTGVIKWIIARMTEAGVQGNPARYVSIAVAVLVTLVALAVGQLDIPMPAACTLETALACAGDWLSWAALVVTAANIAYEQIWERIAPSNGETPALG